MNAVEFVFAFCTVFGVSSFWYVWTSFVYRLENAKEELERDMEEKSGKRLKEQIN